MKFAISNSKELNKFIKCPCSKCKNICFKSDGEVKYDLFANGFLESYTVWNLHGEDVNDGSRNFTTNMEHEDVFDQFEMLRDAFGQNYDNNEEAEEEPNFEASKFYKNLKSGAAPIYPGNTNFTKLTLVTKLLHFKNRHGCSDKGFNELLSLFGAVLPENHTLPPDYKEVKKLVKKLNLGYEKIDACENDCMLFYGEDRNNTFCKYCTLSRYKDATAGGSQTIPRKILRYFRLTPRLQLLYMSSRTAIHMKWYKKRQVREGILTHPADGQEWKNFDKNYPDFAHEIRNIRLGLATDGFSPFTNTSSTKYSVWPVTMVVYNLPPSMCMKDPYIFMTLLVPGPNDPTKNLNVYLRPLIDELKQLWQFGVHTYDASTKTNFTLRATLLWTINDFPGLAMTSGW